MTRRSFLRNLGALAGAVSIGLTVTRPQRGFRKDYYQTLTVKGPDNSVLVGYKGAQFLDPGVIYAPYIPLYRTPDIIVGSMPPHFIHKFANLPLTSGKNLLQSKQMLLMTEGCHLEERNSWHDGFWGTDVNGVGENNLGKILMEIRYDLKTKEEKF